MLSVSLYRSVPISILPWVKSEAANTPLKEPYEDIMVKEEKESARLGHVIERFYFIVESNERLPWFHFTTLYDWSEKLAPLSQSIRTGTKTNLDLLVRVSSRLAFPTCTSFRSDWSLVFLTLVLTGQND